MEAPKKPMQLVVSAIKDLREPNGPTPRKIAKYIMSRCLGDASKLKRQVDTALKRGVTYGILRTDKGRYQLDLEDGSKNMRSHRCRRSRSGSRHRRGGRRRSSSRRRRRHSLSRSRRGGRRRRSSHTRHRRRFRSRRDLPARRRKKVSE